MYSIEALDEYFQSSITSGNLDTSKDLQTILTWIMAMYRKIQGLITHSVSTNPVSSYLPRIHPLVPNVFMYTQPKQLNW